MRVRLGICLLHCPLRQLTDSEELAQHSGTDLGLRIIPAMVIGVTLRSQNRASWLTTLRISHLFLAKGNDISSMKFS